MNNDSATEIHQKDNWLRYAFWAAAVAIVVLGIWFFVNMFSNKTASVPSGYKFSVSDHFAKNTATWSTYYVYDNYILVQNDDPEADPAPAPLVYDGIDTSNLTYDESATTRTCDTDSCYDYPKVITAIKKSIVGHASREYMGR